MAGMRQVTGLTVEELAIHAGATLVPGTRAAEQVAAVRIGGISEVHTEVRPGDLFVALQGRRRHGAARAEDAVAAGASAVLTDPAGARVLRDAPGVPLLVVADPRAALGPLASLLHGHPSRHLPVFGITGTNGKTTTAYILEAAMQQLGRRPGLLSTPETVVGTQREPSGMTTPSAPHAQELLARMRAAGNRSAVMEVSSHALDQERVTGIRFDTVAFTNLTHEHLDYHGSMESYFRAKARLFTPDFASRAVIVVDDDAGRCLDRLARSRGLETTTLSTRTEAAATWRVHGTPGSDDFTLRGSRGKLPLRSPLPGEHNRVNTAVAALVLLGAGCSQPEVARALDGPVSVPGRMDRVDLGPHGPTVLVDFAHTPDATAKSVSALRARTRGRLVVTASSGGDRDRAKRPLTGRAVVEAGADVVLVTDDNPRSEDPAAIRAEVMAGVRAGVRARRAAGLPEPQVVETASRREAIRTALELAGPDDTVALYGKGHERWMEIGPQGGRVPFVDREEVLAAAAPRGGAASS
ncbi:UDP-N-acetylmuramoyl-L-alanyl-D-glutamate--2,6-diaminopimelate ligase [Kocuria tytonicola]|uniref:UDP-N-acetylmuramoyl-L-alanyl-D-glutamate--2,6-diaminopimelate ligase n=1 Tax=Kocuria tytonicola TaxID=2055946 RepID=A0A3L9L6T4_9MICC|nr:UDP-N-acetylmuramoyl-L-alanyl-D-glutamate--2,6-diaminopimelate ligase [Kocuria tytonicola]RLY94520.1 UDP-N-acetylmuramoyl-L-alanyl-D-glutamate--2,6-diaminopimelate ligase [Kocuria tytonicola]